MSARRKAARSGLHYLAAVASFAARNVFPAGEVAEVLVEHAPRCRRPQGPPVPL